MIEKIYKEKLEVRMKEIDRLTFPETMLFCRDLMGLKQYACAEFLAFEQPRYKKLERGLFSEPIEAWEMMRLQGFFHLPRGMLQSKQKEFLIGNVGNQTETIENVWSKSESTRGVRNTRAGGDYKRVRGGLEYDDDLEVEV